MSSNKPYVISNYADPTQRRYHPFLGHLISLLSLFVYFFSAMLPILVPSFALGVLLYGPSFLLPPWALKLLATAIVLDTIIPLDNDGYHPLPHRKSFFERAFAECAQDYFPGRSIFLPQLQRDRTYLLAAWPHGVFGGAHHLGMVDFTERAGVHVIYSGASVLLYIPFLRRFLTLLGFTSVTKRALRRVLDGPTFPYNVVHLVVGGIEEMFYTPGSAREYEQIILRKRKGFIKLALETGADIIPMYSFGANQVYYRIAGPHSLLCRLSRLMRVSITPWLGRWNVPMSVIGRVQPILTVTGEVFCVPRDVKEITPELIHQVHEDFCKALRKLFDEYKVVYVKEMGADASWLEKELIFEDEIRN